MRFARFPQLVRVFLGASRVGPVGDDSHGRAGGLPDEPFRQRVRFDALDAQLRRAQDARDHRGHDDRDDEPGGDFHAVRPFDDVGDRRVDEHQRDRGKRETRRHALVERRKRHGHRRRRHQHEHAGRIRAALRLHVGAENVGDEERDRGEQQHQRARGLRPFRRHAVAREILRHEVQQTRHRRCAGEPQDGDRAQIVGGPELLAEQRVGEIRERAARRGAARPEECGRNQQRRHEGAAHQHDAHDQGRRTQQLAGIAHPSRQVLVALLVRLDERHQRHARFEAGQAERQLREQEQGERRHHHRAPVLGHERILPARNILRVVQQRVERRPDYDQVQREVRADDAHGQPDRLTKAFEEHTRQQPQQHEGHPDLMVEDVGEERIADDVRRGVGCRERDGDHEVGGGKPEQHQHERLAAPPRQQLFEHRDAALPVRTVPRHAPVDRQRAEQREEDQDERRDRREGAGGEKGDAGLVAERRKVVNARQAHHLPPCVLVDVPRVRADRLAKPFEKPSI